tara:strand:- start:777 stop:1589 length:813 start_codon:yes stop_codon:yes gene_type:complete
MWGLSIALLVALVVRVLIRSWLRHEEPLSVSGASVGMNLGNTGGDLSQIDKIASTGVRWIRLEQDFPADVARADALELNVLMLLKSRRTFAEGDLTTDQHIAAIVAGMRKFPDVGVYEILNEPNNLWWDGVTAEEYAAICRGVRPHLSDGQRLAGPAVAGDLPRSLEYVSEVLRLAPGCLDIVTVHVYGDAADVAAYVEAIPGDLPVWLTETAYSPDQTEEEQRDQLEGALRAQQSSPRWEVTFPYHWSVDRRFPIKGTATEALLRRALL